MIRGHQLPVWSPLTLGAIGAGLAAAGGGDGALAALREGVRGEYGALEVTLTGSGTEALALSFLASAPPGRRPRVALPGWGCYDLMTAADIADAEVVLYDLDAATLGPGRDSLAHALAAEPQALVVAHWFGLPVDTRPIAAAVTAAGALLIDDAAQGVGALIGTRPAGSTGDFGVLSFGRGKGRTGGGGGALLALTEPAAHRLRAVEERLAAPTSAARSLAALAAQWLLGRPSLYGIPAGLPALRLGETIYHPPHPPRRMPNRSAAVVNAVWADSAAEAIARRRIAGRWAEVLAGGVQVTGYAPPPDSEAGWLRYPVLVSDAAREQWSQSGVRRLGVLPSYPRTLSDLELKPGRLIESTSALPGSRSLCRGIFTLPTHSLLRERDLDAICEFLQVWTR